VPAVDPTLGLDACQLLSPEEIARVLRVQSFGAGVEEPAVLGGAVACEWDSTNPTAPSSVRVEIAAGDPDALRTSFDELTASATEDVPGVGDVARFDPLTRTFGVLAQRNLITVNVQGEAAGDGAIAAVSSELVELLLPRLAQ